MRSPLRVTMLGAGLVALALAALATQAAGSGAGTPTCTASQLKGRWLNSHGAAGTIVFSVTLKNGGVACSLKGYPSLRNTGARGRLLPTHVVHGGLAVLNSAPKRVKLAHLGRVTVLISYGDVPVRGESTCSQGKTLRLRPPGASGWLSVAARTYACNHGTLHESPVLAGVRHA